MKIRLTEEQKLLLSREDAEHTIRKRNFNHINFTQEERMDILANIAEKTKRKEEKLSTRYRTEQIVRNVIEYRFPKIFDYKIKTMFEDEGYKEFFLEELERKIKGSRVSEYLQESTRSNSFLILPPDACLFTITVGNIKAIGRHPIYGGGKGYIEHYVPDCQFPDVMNIKRIPLF